MGYTNIEVLNSGIPMIRDLLDSGHHITIATRGNVLDPFGNSASRIKIQQKPDEA